MNAARPFNHKLSVGARALTKKKGQGGWPSPAGSATNINRQAREAIDAVLTDPGRRRLAYEHSRLGRVVDVIGSDGRGVRFSEAGDFIGLLKPPR